MTAPSTLPTRAGVRVDLDDPAWQRAIEKARRTQPASDPISNTPIGVRAWTVQGSEKYVVMLRADGTWSCSCKASGPCYHKATNYLAHVARPTYVDIRRRYGAALADWLYAELIAPAPCRECGEQPAAVETGRCIDCAQEAA